MIVALNICICRQRNNQTHYKFEKNETYWKNYQKDLSLKHGSGVEEYSDQNIKNDDYQINPRDIERNQIDPRDQRNPRDQINSRDHRNQRDPKDHRNPGDQRDKRYQRDQRDQRIPRDHKKNNKFRKRSFLRLISSIIFIAVIAAVTALLVYIGVRVINKILIRGRQRLPPLSQNGNEGGNINVNRVAPNIQSQLNLPPINDYVNINHESYSINETKPEVIYPKLDKFTTTSNEEHFFHGGNKHTERNSNYKK